jgi:hypothetical protein
MIEPPPFSIMPGKHRLGHVVLRLHVEVEGEVPGIVVTFQDGAVMNVAGAVEQYVHRADLADNALDLLRLRHVQQVGLDAACL